ncbi:MAG: septum site-determining protein MinC [Lachnospiraceae bacterium]|nr:septum site-determining protein MinC [Lachnospiraceae bacterium]
MSDLVSIKGNKAGLTIYLSEDAPFEQLIEEAAAKFAAAEAFFGEAKKVLVFEGKKLTSEQQMEFVNIIEANTKLSIVYIMDENEKERKFFEFLMGVGEAPKAPETFAFSNAPQFVPQAPQEEEPDYPIAQIYKGNVRSGSVLETDKNIIIFGDVNAGATVLSEGSIIIIGGLRGTAYAGSKGNKNTFVFALDMNPIQIRIDDIMARRPDDEPASNEKEISEPKIAFIEEETICIEPFSKSVLNDIKF